MGLSHAALVSAYIGRDRVVVCDSSVSTAFLFRVLGFRTARSIEYAVATFNIKAGIVATPTTSHAEVVKELIQARIPCLVEKPLTLDVKKSADLKKQAEEAGDYLQVGFVLRFISTFTSLKRIVDSRCMGRALRYKASMRGNAVGPETNLSGWRGDSTLGGGCLNEYGPHLLDLCLNSFGAVCQVNRAIGESQYSPNADDNISIELLHEGGIKGDIEMDWADQSLRKSLVQLEVEFQFGRVFCDQSKLDIPEANDAVRRDDLEFIVSQSEVPPNVGFYLRGEEFSLQLEEFMKNINYPGFVGPTFGAVGASVGDGLAVDTLIADIRKSESRL